MYASNTMNRCVETSDDAGVPTPERFSKSDFYKGTPYKVISTVEALLNAGAISEEESNAASRLRRDLIFAQEGYRDPHPHSAQATFHHDQISWQMTRAQVGARVSRIRDLVRPTIFKLLNLMLAGEMSFSSIAKILMPDSDAATARKKASAQCALALKVLHETYQDLATMRSQETEASMTPPQRKKSAGENVKV